MVTLVWGRQFKVTRVTPTSVRVVLGETKGTRYVERGEVEKAFVALNEKGALSIEELRHFAPRTASYAAALLVRVPGVGWDPTRRALISSAVAAKLSEAGEAPQVKVSSGGSATAGVAPAPSPEAPLSLDALWSEQAGEVLGVWQGLNPMVQREIAAMALADVAQTLRLVKTCESPPEQLLAARLLAVARSVALVDDFELEPQHVVRTRSGEVRVDLLARGRVGGSAVNLAVECDGHTYHGTAAQAARDRQRDRDLRLEGYNVVRFSAMEIMEDPEECALEVFRQMLAPLQPGRR